MIKIWTKYNKYYLVGHASMTQEILLSPRQFSSMNCCFQHIWLPVFVKGHYLQPKLKTEADTVFYCGGRFKYPKIILESDQG